MTHRVVFSPEASEDLLGLYDYISARSGGVQALRYIERIERWCEGLRRFPERGVVRDDIRSGVRVMGFERRVTIAFRVLPDTVTILRILYSGRDLLKALRKAG